MILKGILRKKNRKEWTFGCEERGQSKHRNEIPCSIKCAWYLHKIRHH